MRIWILIVWSILSFGSHASSMEIGILQQIYYQAKNFYSLGHDNNSIVYEVLDKYNFDALIKKSNHLSTFNASDFEKSKPAIRLAVRDCVFMQKGAYGPHLDYMTQEMIVDRYMDTLSNHATRHNVWFFKLGGEGLLKGVDIISAPCALAAFYNGRYLVMQASSVD